MTTKTYEEFMSEINSMNIKEALKNAEKCLEAFTPEDIIKQQQETIESQKAEIERLTAFKSYFDELYGKGLDIANWHKNGDLEPFDSFYNSALEEMEGDTK